MRYFYKLVKKISIRSQANTDFVTTIINSKQIVYGVILFFRDIHYLRDEVKLNKYRSIFLLIYHYLVRLCTNYKLQIEYKSKVKNANNYKDKSLRQNHFYLQLFLYIVSVNYVLMCWHTDECWSQSKVIFDLYGFKNTRTISVEKNTFMAHKCKF